MEVDAGGMIRLCTLQDYQKTCSPVSWDMVMFYANRLRAAGTKVAFFSATPQGGGVALMRHALVRFSQLLNLNVKWYGACFSFCAVRIEVATGTSTNKKFQFPNLDKPYFALPKTYTTFSKVLLARTRLSWRGTKPLLLTG